MTGPDGNATVYTYDKANRLVELKDWKGEDYMFEYDAANRRMKMVYPTGAVQTYEFDAASRALSLRNRMSSDAVIADFTYTYDANGNRLTKTNDQGLHEYGYDKLNRLVPAKSVPDGNSVYGYDAVGNRLSLTKDGQLTTNAFDVDNRQLSSNGIMFGYDANGNQTRKQGTGYVYDFRNRLVGVIGGKAKKGNGGDDDDADDGKRRGKSGEFHGEGKDEGHGKDGNEGEGRKGKRRGVVFEAGYAPDGSRVFKSERGDTTFFVYDLEDIIAEIDTIGQIKRRITHGPGIDEPLSITDIATGKTHYLHYDALGSVVSVTDAAQAIAERYHYDAFGNRLEASALGISYSFTAREWDGSSALYYYRSRQYDPTQGRFAREDEFRGIDLRPASLHRFTYVENNPVNFIDPYGLCSGYWATVKSQLQAIPDNTPYVCVDVSGNFYGSTTGGISCQSIPSPLVLQAFKEALSGSGSASTTLLNKIKDAIKASTVISDIKNNVNSVANFLSKEAAKSGTSLTNEDITPLLPSSANFAGNPDLGFVLGNTSINIPPSNVKVNSISTTSSCQYKYQYSGSIGIHDDYNFNSPFAAGPLGYVGWKLQNNGCLTQYSVDVDIPIGGTGSGTYP